MKHCVTKFKSLKVALKELRPFIHNGEHLRTGRPFQKFDGMRSREALANWLICVVKNFEERSERYTFASDPTGGDGIVHDTKTGHTWPTEHVMVPPFKEGEPRDIDGAILKAIGAKQAKGGAAYASGKTLIVFLESGANAPWFPNRVARALPKIDFEQALVVGLQRVTSLGCYIYGVTALDLSGGNAPTWVVRVNPHFKTWTVEQLQ